MTWFIHFDEKILGPFPTEQVLKNLQNGDLSYSAYIWAKGQVEWVPIAEWEANLDTLVSPDEKPNQLWKLRSPKFTEENLNFQGAVNLLKSLENYQLVSISPQDEEDWVPIYSSYTFMEALNMSRRNFLRAPLMGLSKVTKDGSRFSYVVKTATVGQGGIGVYGLGPNFEPGTQVQLKIESEDLSSSITAIGTIVYNTDKGFVGIRFGELTAETTSVLIDYMRRFQEQDESSQQKAS